jgi:hypothetical protein
MVSVGIFWQIKDPIPSNEHRCQHIYVVFHFVSHTTGSVLVAFPKLRKATVHFVMSLLLSAWNNSAQNGRISIKFNIRVFSENLWGKFKFH